MRGVHVAAALVVTTYQLIIVSIQPEGITTLSYRPPLHPFDDRGFRPTQVRLVEPYSLPRHNRGP